MRIKIKGYQIIDNLEFEVKGITVIAGKTNNGKSAIFRALLAACFGSPGDTFIRDGESQSIVSIMDDRQWTWRKYSGSAAFYLDEHEFNKTGGIPPDEYTKSLNVRKISVGKFDLAPNFAWQFETLFIVGLSPVDTASALAFLFGGEKFPNLLKNISSTIRQAKQEATYLEGVIAVLDEDIKKLETKKAGGQKYIPLIEKRLDMQNMAQVYRDLSADVSSLWSLAQSISAAQESKADLETKSWAFEKVDESSLDEFEDMMLDLESLDRSEIGEIQVSLAGQKECLFHLSKLKADICGEFESMLGDLQFLETTSAVISQLGAKVEGLRSLLTKANTEVGEAKDQLKECPLCGLELTEPAKERVLAV